MATSPASTARSRWLALAGVAALLGPIGPSASAATQPCAAAIAQARADLDHTGLAISQAQKQLAVILLASRGRLDPSELRQAIVQLERLDQAAAMILPAGRLQRDLRQRAAVREAQLHAPAA